MIDHIGLLIDAARDAGQPAGARGQTMRTLKVRGFAEPMEATLLDYFESNAWSQLAPCPLANPAEAWAWKHVAFDNALRLLRRAQRSPGISELGPERRSQICTNLANAA